MIGFFGEVCVSFWKEITVTVNFLLLMLKCLKFNCFMLQDQNIKSIFYRSTPIQILAHAEVLIIYTEGFFSFFKIHAEDTCELE